MTCTITLNDLPGLPEDAREKAQGQYRRALEPALGRAR